MKGIIAILKELGIEVPKDKEKAVESAVGENFRAEEDCKKLEDELEKLKTSAGEGEKTIAELKEQIKAAPAGEDVEKMKRTIAELEEKNQKIESEYKDKLADRDFGDLLKTAITEAKGRNAKAITALLDLEALKASKNQKEDVAAAIRKLAEAEDSSMLFGEKEPQKVGTGNPIGTFGQSGGGEDDSAMRAVMGLPAEKGQS